MDRVVAALRERGVEPFRADTAWFPRRLSVAAELDGEAWSGTAAIAELLLDGDRA